MNIKNNKGTALVMVMMVILILLVLGTAVLSITINEYRMAKAFRDDVAAYYLAEAGLEKAIYHIARMKEIYPDQLSTEKWEMGEEDEDLLKPGTRGIFIVTVENIYLIDTVLAGEDVYKYIYEVTLKSQAVVEKMTGEIETVIRVEDYTAENSLTQVQVEYWRQKR